MDYDCGCYDDDIAGLSEDDMKLFAGATGGYVGTAYLDYMLQYEKDGTPKTGKIAEEHTMRNAGYAAAGWGIAYMWGKQDTLIKGAGIGMTVFGIKQLIRNQYPDAGIEGIRPQGQQKYIAGGRRTTGQQKYIGIVRKNTQARKQYQKTTTQAPSQDRIIIENVY